MADSLEDGASKYSHDPMRNRVKNRGDLFRPFQCDLFVWADTKALIRAYQRLQLVCRFNDCREVPDGSKIDPEPSAGRAGTCKQKILGNRNMHDGSAWAPDTRLKVGSPFWIIAGKKEGYLPLRELAYSDDRWVWVVHDYPDPGPHRSRGIGPVS
jgi:hypothetical protein